MCEERLEGKCGVINSPSMLKGLSKIILQPVHYQLNQFVGNILRKTKCLKFKAIGKEQFLLLPLS